MGISPIETRGVEVLGYAGVMWCVCLRFGEQSPPPCSLKRQHYEVR